jgi:tellurite resistance protein TehA-like permease
MAMLSTIHIYDPPTLDCFWIANPNESYIHPAVIITYLLMTIILATTIVVICHHHHHHHHMPKTHDMPIEVELMPPNSTSLKP